MKSRTPRIIINGRVSDLMTKNFFTISDKMKNYSLVLFCDHSEFDIPIGAKFNRIMNGDFIIFSGNIILKKVTQQFAIEMECIPKGWKTICQFELNDKLPESIGLTIPIVDNWYSDNRVTYEIQ